WVPVFGPDHAQKPGGRKRGGSTPRIGTANMFATAPTWTTERLELLKGHFASGLTCRQIAAEIGVSRNAVIGKLSRLGLTRDKPPGGEARPARPRERRGRPVPRLQLEMLRQGYEDEPATATQIVSEHRRSPSELSKE